MAIRHGIVASSVALPPSVTIDAVTNFNQNIATFNATVNPNGYTTSVKFQYKKTADSTWTDGETITGLTGGSQSVYSNQTGLNGYGDNGGIYDVRALATNSVDTTTSGTASFTTWALQVYERSTSGGTTFTIPTVTPTGGSVVAVSILDIIMFGAGGGASGTGGSGGGGGGYQSVSSRSLTGSRSITTSVGLAGSGDGSNGGNTTITGDITSLTANGGNGSSNSTFTAGSSGNGNAGGVYATYDPDGSGKGLANTAFGGGGGAGAVGNNGVANASGTFGGNGGAGVSITLGGVTRAGGAGGGGGTSVPQPVGTTSDGSRGANNSYGSGANGHSSSTAQDGYIRFRYYAASALA
jgi:hypothetical protein